MVFRPVATLRVLVVSAGLFAAVSLAHAQPTPASPGSTPSGPHLPADAAPIGADVSPGRRYAPMPADEIRATLERVRRYLDATTPFALVDRESGKPVTVAGDTLPAGAELARGDFRLVSYEWGVTYAGMLHAAEVTGEAGYRTYVAERVKFIAEVAPLFRDDGTNRRNPFRAINGPRSLDDSGAMGAAFIKASRAGIHADLLRPYIDRYLAWISTGQKRLGDGTLARDRPLHDALWLDDLYMSVPALAQMGALTGEQRYFDDACRQIVQFHQRMFVPGKGLFMHGWIQAMEPHPVFHWARANGWAIVAAAELLSVLPEDHPRRSEVLAIFRAHAAGLAACQGGSGLWHQLLDRNDSYPETSATAMFVYAIARGINRGWLQPLAYGPVVSVGWNAVARQVNEKGEVHGTCVGTGMGFEPAFYYERPTSPRAAHGYGPVLHAGAEMITLFSGKGSDALISDGAVQFQRSPSLH